MKGEDEPRFEVYSKKQTIEQHAYLPLFNFYFNLVLIFKPLSIMRKTWLLLCCLLLIAGTTYAQKGGANYRSATTDCSSNGGPNIEVCYTESSFQLLGEDGTGNVNSTPNYTWTGPPGFTFSPTNLMKQPTVTQTGGLTPGTYTFTFCTDCDNGTSCNDITVTIGDDPVEPTSINVDYSACGEATITVLPTLGAGDVGQWSWTPVSTQFSQTSGQTGNVGVFAQSANSCGNQTVTYTVANGGCESQSISTPVSIYNLPAVSAGNNRTFCTPNGAFTHWGSGLGCHGATATWTQVSGPAILFGTTNNGRTLNASAPLGGTFTFEYTVTPPVGSPCVGGTDQVTFTIVIGTGFELGNSPVQYFCGEFPSTIQVCANAGGPTYNWSVHSGTGVTISPVAGSPECQNVNFTPGGSLNVTIRVQDPGGNGSCGDNRYFYFRRLDNPDVIAEDVGIGCFSGPVNLDLRDYLTGFSTSQTVSVVTNSVPTGSGAPVGSQSSWYVLSDVNGCYDYTITVTNTDAITGQQCSITLDLQVCRYDDVESPNCGEDQTVCADNTTLNGSTPLQAGTMTNWTQLASNPPGAVLSDPSISDPVVSGLDIGTNGTTYGFVYTFTLDNPAGGSCSEQCTVYVSIDCPTNPCDTLDLDAAFSTTIPVNSYTATFQDQSTIGPGFAIDYLTWFFYDDSGNLLNAPGTLDLPGNSISYTFPGPGMYITCLQASAYLPNDPFNLCCHDMVCDTFIIEDPDTCALHHAGFSHSISGNTVTFTDVSTHGDVTKWDFDGDGVWDAIGPGVGSTASHTFPGPGTYEVCMVSIWNYTDSTCCHDTICERITITSGCTTPRNLRCRTNKFGIPTYYWDAVPGAGGYQIQVTINDPNCCERPSTRPYSLALIYVTGTSWTPNVSYLCASFSVRTRCPKGWSRFSERVCMDCRRRLEEQGPGGQVLVAGGGRRTAGDPANDIKTYPSPASNFLTVEGMAIEEGTSIILVDAAGRVVLTKQVETTGKQSIRTADLPNGIYFLKVQGASSEVQSRKVVILH